MSASTVANDQHARLAVVLVQHDREKYPRALLRLLSACGRLSADTLFVVVDNAIPGNWAHSVSKSLHHIAGDNAQWEFSAFDKGLCWLEQQGYEADVYALATDALLAYGEEFLELVDDPVIESCRRYSACIGWVDSFLERCEILGYPYEAWLRTSLLFVPAPLLPAVYPLALELEDSALFGPGPERPFLSSAPLSQNLKRLLLEWLTVTEDGDENARDEVWHSRFRLDADSFDLFKAKVKAILREHILSARLKANQVPCYDLRAIELAHRRGELEAALGSEADTAWQWLGWRAKAAEPERPVAVAEDWPPALGGERAGNSWTFVLTGIEGDRNAAEAIRFFHQGVMPLVLQRHAGARLVVECADPDFIAEIDRGGGTPQFEVAGTRDLRDAVALLTTPRSESRREILTRADKRGLPVVGAWSSADDPVAMRRRQVLIAEFSWQYADACCRLIEATHLGTRLGSALDELVADANSGLEPGPAADGTN